MQLTKCDGWSFHVFIQSKTWVHLDHKSALLPSPILPFICCVFPFLSFHLKPDIGIWNGAFPPVQCLAILEAAKCEIMVGFCKISFIFVCSMQPQFQSVCVLIHLKNVGLHIGDGSTGVKMGVCPLYPPCWELVISFQTQMIFPALSTEHCTASTIRQLFSSALNLRILYDNRVQRNEETQSMKRDFNMRLYCARGRRSETRIDLWQTLKDLLDSGLV